MGQQEIKQGLEGITPNQEFAVGDWGTPEPAVPKKKKVCCFYRCLMYCTSASH